MNAAALSQILDSTALPQQSTARWMAAVIFAPVVGALIWFVFSARTRQPASTSTTGKNAPRSPTADEIQRLHDGIDRYRARQKG
jgi:hypothetical protein